MFKWRFLGKKKVKIVADNIVGKVEPKVATVNPWLGLIMRDDKDKKQCHENMEEEMHGKDFTKKK
jgi:hypothetical protein